MTEYSPQLSLDEIDKLNQIIYEGHPQAEAEALAADVFFQTVALNGFQKAKNALVFARIATRKPKEFYDEYRDALHELAIIEDKDTSRHLSE